MGNRYGFQPFPAKIGYEEFENLLKVAEETNEEGSELLSEWFMKDENVVPPEYILQVRYVCIAFSHLVNVLGQFQTDPADHKQICYNLLLNEIG